MIIDQDLLAELGVIIDFLTKTMTWDWATIEMDNVRRKEYNNTGSYDEEPSSAREVCRHTLWILDSMYNADDLTKIIQNCTDMDTNQRIELMAVLQKHRKLFDGTMGIFKGKELSLEVKKGVETVQ